MAAFKIHEDNENILALDNQKNVARKQIVKIAVQNINQEKMIAKKYLQPGKIVLQKKSFLDNQGIVQLQKNVKISSMLHCNTSEENKEEAIDGSVIEEQFLQTDKENRMLSFKSEKDTFPLILLHNTEYRKMFRHGNRTPNGVKELYPLDPYFKKTYFPYGLGQLTNAGKRKLFLVGKDLRSRYNNFLGKYYYPEIVEATSTDVNRTKMSLELVLASLFPPKKEDMVLGMPWQPIPYNFLPEPQDLILSERFSSKYNGRYMELYNGYVNSSSVQKELKKHQHIFKYISEHTGLNVKTYADLYHLQFGLATEQEYGLTLPEWTKSVWPEPMLSLAAEEYFMIMGTPDMRKMVNGFLLDKIIEDAETKMRDGKKLSRKIYLYSAHENNLAELLLALGVFEKHIPPYGAYIILELHEIRGVYGFKIFYKKWDGRGLMLLKMPGCKEFCPIDVFTSLIKKI